MLAEAPAQEFDFATPTIPQRPAPEPVETEPVVAGEPTDNVAIVSGMFGGLDAPEPPRRTEPEGSLGDLVRPAFVPDAPAAQTWLDAPPPVVAAEEPQAPQEPQEPRSGRRAATHTDENVFGG